MGNVGSWGKDGFEPRSSEPYLFLFWFCCLITPGGGGDFHIFAHWTLQDFCQFETQVQCPHCVRRNCAQLQRLASILCCTKATCG